MLGTIRTILGCVLLIHIYLPPVEAHHSGAAVDMSHTTTITGTVKEWLWANPHCWLYVININASGEAEEWGLEASPVVLMARQGLRSTTFKPGDKVAVVFFPRKDGKRGGGLVKVILSDGTMFNVGPPLPPVSPPP